MKRFVITAILCGTSALSHAADTQCLASKYDAYIDASLNWYQDLIRLTSQYNPELKEVGSWFYQGRQNHFELNRAAVHYYLNTDMSKVATEQTIESWLKLEQIDIKNLTNRKDNLGKLAQITFKDRQSKPHPKNYELRSAFADLLSHPDKINTELSKYNTGINAAESINCL